jgi:hypothetical protein
MINNIIVTGCMNVHPVFFALESGKKLHLYSELILEHFITY